MNNLFTGDAFSLRVESQLAILDFDLKSDKVNKFDFKVAEELGTCLDLISKTPKINTLIVFSKKPGIFVAGADLEIIKGFKGKDQAADASKLGQELFSKFEDLKINTIAAIKGVCLGGGCEWALTFKHRLMSDDSKTMMGLPEVKLGLLPGWGGTFRLPKLIGVQSALDMILTGKNIRPKKALKTGLVDQVFPSADFEQRALEFARKVSTSNKIPAKKKTKKSIVNKILDNTPFGRAIVFSQAKKTVMKQTKGHYPAPLKILQLIKNQFGKGRDPSMKAEAKAWSEVWDTPEHKNLLTLFFMIQDNKKESGTSLEESSLKALPSITSIGVLGAGVMGGGIASQSSKSKKYVLMKDINQAAIASGLAHAGGFFNKQKKRRRMTKYEVQSNMDRISGQLGYQGFKDLDMVIEAIVENLDIKKKVFTELETKVSNDCIIASNTSSLCLEDMVSAFAKPERFVGLHFFNPVEKMPLVEVISQAKTSPEVLARAVQYSRDIGKTPVVCKDGPGFLVNRLLLPWLNEATYMLNEGFEISRLDKVMKNFGMPMGPCELLDEVGLDVGCKVAKVLHDAFGERAQPSTALDLLYAATKPGDSQRLGRKNGLGLYNWTGPGGKKQDPDSVAIKEILFKNSVVPDPKKLTDEDLQNRMIFPMINEAAIALSDGIVDKAWCADLAMIFGTGFPPFRGGLLKYADTVGVKNIVAELEKLTKNQGNRIAPSKELIAVAEAGGFYKKYA